ncbi:hypothetical protein BDP27DRAFT_1368723 [Rhodocollybia butyracea]|uniref:Uncharacterized protein n=1 Tax=Rhodocollybia butyracea TaxID=206335 RepID=A0A9P5U1M4_9AGAR|nr:hypothetical protein BDP27DRAFT_1368723 [Rhodocollybia butyracea]
MAPPPAQPFSLFKTLTSSKAPQDYPVAELIKRLLLVVGHEICSPLYSRNILSSYQVVSTARDILDHIQQITIAEDSSESDAWASFEQYIELIEPTETRVPSIILLLELLPVAEKETSRQHEPDDSNGVDGYVAWVGNWQTTRDAVKTALTGLTNIITAQHDDFLRAQNSSLPQLDIQTLRQQDDKSYIQTLFIPDELAQFRRSQKVGTLPSEILKSFKRIDIRYDNETTVVWYTKLAMMLNAIYRLASKKISGGQDDAVPIFQRRLTNIPKIWTSAKDLVDAVQQLVVNEKLEVSHVELKWKALVDALKEISPITPPNYAEIVKLIRDIRRPFYGQAVALVKLFRVLATHFGRKENCTNPEMLSSLQAAMEELKKSLESASTKIATAIMATDLPDDTRAEIEAQFGQAEKVLEECFESFKPESEELTKWQTQISQAKAADKKRVEEFKTRIQSKTYVDSPGSDSTTIEVLVQQSANANPSSFTYTVKTDMRMSALLWRVAQDNPQAIAKATFKSLQEPKKVIGMDAQVKTPHLKKFGESSQFRKAISPSGEGKSSLKVSRILLKLVRARYTSKKFKSKLSAGKDSRPSKNTYGFQERTEQELSKTQRQRDVKKAKGAGRVTIEICHAGV